MYVEESNGYVGKIHIEEVDNFTANNSIHDVPDCAAEYETHGKARSPDIPRKGDEDVEDNAQCNERDDDEKRRFDR